MTPHQKAALELIHDYYFMLPNNGSLNEGINSCESRYREAIYCALVCVKKIILTLEFMAVESDAAFIMDRINFYDEVQSELFKVQSGDSKFSIDEFMETFKK